VFKGVNVDYINTYSVFVTVNDNYGGKTENEIEVQVDLPEVFEGVIIETYEEPILIVEEEEIVIKDAPKLFAKIESIS
jgi:hypothetical protein